MIREVCSAESRSVEPMKINPSHAKIGSQYFRKRRTEPSLSFALANLQSTISLIADL